MLFNPFSAQSTELDPSVVIEQEVSNFIVAVPHAGIHIPDYILQNVNLDNSAWIHDPDHGAKEIYFPLAELGAIVVSTEINRDIVDLNRDGSDDPTRGIISQMAFDGTPLLAKPYTQEQRDKIISDYYHPFFETLDQYVIQMRNEHGKVFILNGHTCAPYAPNIREDPGSKRPSFCIGTNGGNSADSELLTLFEESLREHAKILDDPSVGVNFSGLQGRVGITRIYSRPNEGINTVLIEANRGMYFDEATKTVDQSKASIVAGIIFSTFQDLLPYLR